MYDIIIIGAGISGLTSAIYGARANKKVLVLESLSYGGQIVNSNSIDNYPGVNNISGYDFATYIYKQASDLGVLYKNESVVEITSERVVITKNNKYTAKTIIIATGLSSRKLNILDEDRFIGKGISYCAICDGNFYKNLDVCVVGGGNTAMEDAIYLSNLCHKVYLVHRRDSFRGDDKYLDILKNKSNVEIIYNSNVISVAGDDLLNTVKIRDNKNSTRDISVSGLFIAIGHIPNTSIFSSILTLNKDGYILSDDCTTNLDGVFVAGDVRSKNLRQLVTASSDGAIAASLAINYINNNE